MCRANVLEMDDEEEEGADNDGDDTANSAVDSQPPYVENIERANSNYAKLQASIDSMMERGEVIKPWRWTENPQAWAECAELYSQFIQYVSQFPDYV